MNTKTTTKQWVSCSLLDGDADMVSCNKSTWFVNYIMTIRPKLGEQMSCLGWWSAETWQHLIAFLYLWANFTGHLCLQYTNTACAVFQSRCGFYVKAFQGLAWFTCNWTCKRDRHRLTNWPLLSSTQFCRKIIKKSNQENWHSYSAVICMTINNARLCYKSLRVF